METRICHRCGTEVGKRDVCPICTEELKYAKPGNMMSPEERLVEFDSWCGILEVDFRSMRARLEQLVGRSIWTNELCTSNIESLRQEIVGAKQHPEFLDEITSSLPEHIEVINLDLDNPSDEEFSAN